MFKFVNKRLRNRKGFTLIELIVVIAILGILAAIAVPRLGGFTDRAKQAADEQLGAIIKNSLAIEIASGNIRLASPGTTDGKVTLTKSTGKYTLSNLLPRTGTTALTETQLTDMMNDLVGDVSTGEEKAMQYYDTLTFTIDKDTQEVTYVAE